MSENEKILTAIKVLKEYGKEASILTLIHAAQDNDINIAKLCIDAGVSVNSFCENKWLALNQACIYGHLEIVEFLLDNGADINKRDKNSSKNDGKGFTPLINAIYKNQVSIIKFLISKGVDLNITDDYGWSPLQHVYNLKNNEIRNILLENGVKDIEDQQKNKIAKSSSKDKSLYRFISIVFTALLFGSLFLKGYALKNSGIEYQSGSVYNILFVQMGWFYYIGIIILALGCVFAIIEGNVGIIAVSSIVWICFLTYVLIAIGLTSTQDYFSGDILIKNAWKFQYGWYIHYIFTLIVAIPGLIIAKMNQ